MATGDGAESEKDGAESQSPSPSPRSKRNPPASSQAASRAPRSLQIPKSIDNKYDVVALLGKGGMGAVYEATNRQSGRRVAIKVIVSEALAKEPEILSRFRREARASGTVDSPHVVQVLDTGIDSTSGTNNPYMVMEHLEGEDLSNLIHRLGPLPPQLVVNIAAQACLGLERAHAAGIVHRDIKSANIFLSRRDGGEVTVKILDFGIAKVRADPLAPHATSHHLTRTGTMLGSPLYMSPEQARGMKTLDGRADLWSLGVVMYEALTGNPPNAHCESLGELLLGICSEDAPPVVEKAPWVSSSIAAVVKKALTREATQRYASAEEMCAALSALAPRGISIHDSMIAALPADMRAMRRSSTPPVAIINSQGATTPFSSAPPRSETLVAEPALPIAPPPVAVAAAVVAAAAAGTPLPTSQTGPSLVSAAASTMSGVGQTTDPQADVFRSSAPASSTVARSSSKAFIAAGVVAAVLFASVGTIAVVKNRKSVQATQEMSAGSASIAAAPAPAPTPSPTPTPTPVDSVAAPPSADVADASVAITAPATPKPTTAAGKPSSLPPPAAKTIRPEFSGSTTTTTTTKPAAAAKSAEPSEPAIQRNF